MAKILDFNKRPKRYLTVVLPDKNKTRLMVAMPTKLLMQELLSTFQGLQDKAPTPEDMTQIYNFCGRLMSRNKTMQPVTGEQLADCLDMEDVVAFIEEYSDFVLEASNEKN